MKFYTSIDDMPIYNWFKCIEGNLYEFVLISGKAPIEACQEVFGVLYFQYVDMFGVSDQLQDILSLQNEILILKIEKALENDKSKQTFIDLKELELKDLLNIKQQKTNSSKVAIEKYLGFRINEKEVTVKEFYDYLEAIKEDNGRG